MMKKLNKTIKGVNIEINNKAHYQIDLNLIRRAVAEFARIYKIRQREISIAFVGDAEIKKLNQAYRKISQPTDILTFSGEDDFLGELIIDYRQVKKQACRFGNSASQELVFILVHGLLHLLGYNDETEKEKAGMIKRGEEFIKKFKIRS